MTPNKDSICFTLRMKDSNHILMTICPINLAKAALKKPHLDILKCRIFIFKLRTNYLSQLLSLPPGKVWIN